MHQLLICIVLLLINQDMPDNEIAFHVDELREISFLMMKSTRVSWFPIKTIHILCIFLSQETKKQVLF